MTLKALGGFLKSNQTAIRRLQWGMVGLYAALVGLPAFLELPDRTQHVWNNLVLFAQFAFWGIWWPMVLIATLLLGRVWCGFFCPEGTLTQWASQRGKGHATPRWVRWGGWPFVAFALTTLYGQMVSVYQYPKPALLILGGSTLAAIAIGFMYGRGKRVWCRYLCPVNGVFGLLAKLSPFHFKVDQEAWQTSQARHEPLAAFTCAPLVAVRNMQGASACHMCGRCQGFRKAVNLSLRSPAHEIVEVAGRQASPWESALILFGLLGVAMGAFHWSGSSLFIGLKQGLAEVLVGQGWIWPLENGLPWWLLTDYPRQNDVMSLLDGAALILFVLGTAAVMGVGLGFCAWLAALSGGRAHLWARFHHLVQGLIPLAAAGVVLGLSALSVTILRSEGLQLGWVNPVRFAVLGLAALGSLYLVWAIAGRYERGIRRLASFTAMLGAVGLGTFGWVSLFVG